MFARQLYKQAAITPSSCREFRTLLFVNARPAGSFACAHPELPRRRTPSCLTLTMSCAAPVIIYHILLCVLLLARLQFSCPIRSETPDYMDLFNTASHCIKRTSILYRFASNWFYRIQFGSRIIAFPSRNLALKNGGGGVHLSSLIL